MAAALLFDPPEIWREVPSVPYILVSSHGRITTRKIYRPMPHGGIRPYGGTPGFGQWDGTRYIYRVKSLGQTFKVARLVCEAFNGSAPENNNVCLHRNENSRDNRPSNLEWGTQKQNLNAPGFIEYQRRAVRWKLHGEPKPANQQEPTQ